jgi:hypothetical protein
MSLVIVLMATAVAAYGVWYGIFVNEFTARTPYTGRVKYRYKPSPYQRVMVCAGSLIILISGLVEVVRLWKSK